MVWQSLWHTSQRTRAHGRAPHSSFHPTHGTPFPPQDRTLIARDAAQLGPEDHSAVVGSTAGAHRPSPTPTGDEPTMSCGTDANKRRSSSLNKQRCGRCPLKPIGVGDELTTAKTRKRFGAQGQLEIVEESLQSNFLYPRLTIQRVVS